MWAQITKPATQPQLVGKVVHAVLQEFNRARWREDTTFRDNLSDIFHSKWEEERISCEPGLDVDEVKQIQAGLVLLEVYLDQTTIESGEKPMAVEVRIYQRGGKNFYAKDTKTGRTFSLNTSDVVEAKRLLMAKNQSTEQPHLNVAMAKVYLSAQSPEFTKRTWGQLVELVAKGCEGSTAVRWLKFAKSAPLKVLASLLKKWSATSTGAGANRRCGITSRLA